MILVTGASGFLGRHLVAALAERGEDVRTPNRTEFWDDATLHRAAEGCRLVFHLAGVVSHERRDLARMRHVNVEGTRRLLAAVEPEARVVHVSSVSAIGPVSSPELAADEAHDVPVPLPYATSKREAERVALESGRDVVVANPGFLLGPGDVHGVSTWPVHAYVRGTLRFTSPGGLSFVDARDVAAGLVALAERGRTGERTILASRSGNLSWEAFFARVGAVSGRRRRMLSMPRRIAIAGATVLPRPVSADEVRAATYWWFFDGAKAERELGFRVRPLEETIADTLSDGAARSTAGARRRRS